MNKTILVYATRWGATTETAQEIKNVLSEKYNIEVDLVNLKDKKKKENRNPDISPYENIIIGISVAKFRWAKEGKKFLKKNKGALAGKKLFVFVSSGGAGEAYQKRNIEEYERLQKKWIDNNLDKWGIKFTSRKAFGGRYVGQYSHLGDNRDWSQIRSWAEEVGKIIDSGELNC
ncbi:MAG: NAD(P)H-dependent oxidoreductase [Candidatus Heimdallarchaeota archaeon]|nr:MAG: NAD(P)H-dependent oxidoreductase [Candidatus Heimdallarchaeota archaeon]